MESRKQNFELKVASVTASTSFSPYPPETGAFKRLMSGLLGEKRVVAKAGNIIVLITLSALNRDPKAKEGYIDLDTPVVYSNQFVLTDGLGSKYRPIIFYGDRQPDKKIIGVAIAKGQPQIIDVWFEVPESKECLKRQTLSLVDVLKNDKTFIQWKFGFTHKQG